MVPHFTLTHLVLGPGNSSCLGVATTGFWICLNYACLIKGSFWWVPAACCVINHLGHVCFLTKLVKSQVAGNVVFCFSKVPYTLSLPVGVCFTRSLTWCPWSYFTKWWNHSFHLPAFTERFGSFISWCQSLKVSTLNMSTLKKSVGGNGLPYLFI